MIRVAPGRRRYDEPHVLIEIEEEGAAYIAQVMRETQSHDGGALAIAEEIERYLGRVATNG
jgi:hypothetical protein